ncbi:type III pantothenate kinase [bacterium]|nr:type III pantothenate kinase [bacterium]
MLLAVDIGNTNIAVGLFQDKTLKAHWKLESDRKKTCDEYAVTLLNLLSLGGFPRDQIHAVIISSVLPPLTPVFQEMSRKLFGTKPLVVGPGLRTGMAILYENPYEVGADRVVAAVAAFEKYGGPCVVVDFGTATTFDVVSSKGEYLGGVIAPGVQIAGEALYFRAAKLPHVEIKKPPRIIGRTTVSSMQAGLYFGYMGLVSNIIEKIKQELKAETTVISTGGLNSRLDQEIPSIQHYEPFLVLEGLRIIYERNKDMNREKKS